MCVRVWGCAREDWYTAKDESVYPDPEMRQELRDKHLDTWIIPLDNYEFDPKRYRQNGWLCRLCVYVPVRQ